MPPKKTNQPNPALNIRNIPRSTFFRLKMAAAVEEKSVTDLILELIEHKIRELEGKGSCRRGSKLCPHFVCVGGNVESE